MTESRLVTYVDIPPMPKKRPRVTVNGTYMPKDYVEWKQAAGYLIRGALKKQRIPEFVGRIRMDIVFDKKGFLLVIEGTDNNRFGNADLDNLVGAVLDACQDCKVIHNDRDVIELTSRFG